MDRKSYERVDPDELRRELNELVEECEQEYQLGTETNSRGPEQLERDLEYHVVQAVNHLLRAHARFKVTDSHISPDGAFISEMALEVAVATQRGIEEDIPPIEYLINMTTSVDP